MIVKKHGSQVDEVHMTLWVRRYKEKSWLTSMELIWMNYQRLDPLGRGYVGAVMAQPA